MVDENKAQVATGEVNTAGGTENTDDNSQEAGTESPAEEAVPTDELKKKVSELTDDAFKKRIEEMNEVEKRIDSKLTQLREIVDDSHKDGRGLMAKPKETDEDKYIREAKERYAGTGMDPTPPSDEPTKYS